MIDIKDFEVNSSFRNEMEQLINISNLSLKNWEIYWTTFLSQNVYESILNQFKNLNDLSYFVYGGYEGSERAKVACFRKSLQPDKKELIESFPSKGIEIKGNFLFDNANQADFRNLLIENGITEADIGDIWTLGDKGAQGIITNLNQELFNKRISFLREVEVILEIINLEELKTPIKRVKKYINTVEASLRLDTVSSAGFRLSRNKISDRIKSNLVSINGIKVNKSTIKVKVGDKIKLENKGFIEILDIKQTKRERWKIKILKK